MVAVAKKKKKIEWKEEDQKKKRLLDNDDDGYDNDYCDEKQQYLLPAADSIGREETFIFAGIVVLFFFVFRINK